MSKYNKIDLKDICNHKLIYGKETPLEKRKGLDDIYIAKESAHLSHLQTFDGIEFAFNLNGNDNIMCDGQKIHVGTKADRLHLIGFSYWGDTTDIFQAKYDDGDSDWLKISFVDWSHELGSWGRARAYSEISTVHKVISSGAFIHIIHFYHITVELNGNKTLEEIILPNNFWLHIFAMTFEEYEK